MSTLTLHYVHQRVGDSLHTACGIRATRDMHGAANAGHGGPCPACEDGISRDEWARRDRAAWSAYMDGRSPSPTKEP